MVKHLVTLLVCIMVCACIDQTPKNLSTSTQETKKPGVDNANAVISSIVFLDNILQSKKYFVSYNKTASRVSIIDAHSELEVQAWHAKNYDHVLPLPNFDGVALFTNDKVVIKTDTAEKVFKLNNAYRQISAARRKAMYSLASADGKSFEVIRYLGNDQWQHETLQVPWNVPSSNIENTSQDHLKPLVTQYYNDGNQLIAFSPTNGSYAAYNINNTNSAMDNIISWCDGVNSVNDINFPAMASDHSYTFIGDDSGNVYSFINVYENCVLNAEMSLDKLTVIKMDSSAAATHIAFYNSMFDDPLTVEIAFGVIQDLPNQYGSLQLVTYDIDIFGRLLGLKPTLYVDNVCETPISSTKIQNNYILVTCSEVANPSNRDDKLSFVMINLQTGNIENTFSFSNDTTASIAIDSETGLLYRVHEGAFGNLEILNLVNGSTRLVEGLYIRDILN